MNHNKLYRQHIMLIPLLFIGATWAQDSSIVETTKQNVNVISDSIEANTIQIVKQEATSAIDFLRNQDQAVQTILAKSLTDTLPLELRQEVKKKINDAFDFAELGRMSLGDQWYKCTDAERNEFVETFRQIVEEQNFDSFVNYYRDSEIEYLAEEVVEGHTNVQAQVPYERERISITYHLHKVAGSWRIYDLVIDGVSTAQGNRRQYARYIKRHSFEKLLHRLKKQLENLQAAE